jgi:hypothetical protein
MKGWKNFNLQDKIGKENIGFLRNSFIVAGAFFIVLIALLWKSNSGVLGLQTNESKSFTIPPTVPTKTHIPTLTVTMTPEPVQPSITSQPLIDCTGPDGKHLWITKGECDNFNSSWVKPSPVDADPIVICQMGANCGGGVEYVKKSVCSAITCCQVSDTWAIYPSKQTCIDAQNRIQPSITPTPTSTPTPTPFYTNAYLLQQCLDQAFQKYQATQCEQTINPLNENAYSICLANRYQTYQYSFMGCHSSYDN